MKTYDDLINSINDNDQDEDIDQLIENTLDEGFLRLGLITSFIGKTKQYGNRVDSEVRNLNSDISSWVNNKNEDLDKKKLGEVFKTLGVVMFYQRKMMMYSTLVSGSTGIGVDKSFKLLKKIEKSKGRR